MSYKVTISYGSIGLCAWTSAFYPIHYTTQRSVFRFEATESLEKLNAIKTEFPIGTKLKREKISNNIPCLIPGQDTNPSARKGT